MGNTTDPADEQAIRQVYQQLIDAWNAGDGRA
jgi:hypothetical protein